MNFVNYGCEKLRLGHGERKCEINPSPATNQSEKNIYQLVGVNPKKIILIWEILQFIDYS